MSISELEEFALTHCDYERSFATQYLVLTHYLSYAITVALFVFGLRGKEIYLVVMSIGLIANTLLNFLLLAAIAMPIPNPTCGSHALWCTDPRVEGAHCAATLFGTPDPDCVPCGMPAFQVQHSAFFVTSIEIYAMQWHAPHLRFWHQTLLMLWMVLVIYSHAFFGFNSPAQIIAAIFVGSVFSLVWQFLVFFYLVPRFDAVLHWTLLRYVGEYRDTLTRSHRPVPGDPEPLLRIEVAYNDGSKRQ